MITLVLWRVPGHFTHAHVECSNSDECVLLGEWLHRVHGLRVSQHPHWPPVTHVHATRSRHYTSPPAFPPPGSRALDLNVVLPGVSEARKFDALCRGPLAVLHAGRDVRALVGTPSPRPSLPPPPKEEDMPLNAGDKAWIANAIGSKVANAASRTIRHFESALDEELAEHFVLTEEKRVQMAKRLTRRLDKLDDELKADLLDDAPAGDDGG